MSDQTQEQNQEQQLQPEPEVGNADLRSVQTQQSQTLSIDDLQRHVDLLKAQVEENLNGWKRAMADLANYKKQTEEEKKSWAMFSLIGVISPLLPVLDNINSALVAQPPLDTVEGSFKQFLIGLGHIKKQFEDVLTQMDIVEVSGADAEFDPLVHESVSKDGEVTGKGKLVVSNVLTQGYKIHDQLIRPAKVMVKEVVENGNG